MWFTSRINNLSGLHRVVPYSPDASGPYLVPDTRRQLCSSCSMEPNQYIRGHRFKIHEEVENSGATLKGVAGTFTVSPTWSRSSGAELPGPTHSARDRDRHCQRALRCKPSRRFLRFRQHADRNGKWKLSRTDAYGPVRIAFEGKQAWLFVFCWPIRSIHSISSGVIGPLSNARQAR